jgi:probable H4MPT-linked C1 transfer pathway protein
LEKLMNGELVYTGSLRTNVAAAVASVPVRGGVAKVSSELFAQRGDVHLILGNICESDYTVDTADGKGKTRGDALTRLARVVCADTEMLAEEEILQIARYIYSRQVEQIAEGLAQVYSRLKVNAKNVIPVVLTGLGRNFLARKGAEKAGIHKIMDLGELMLKGAAFATPAVGVALMAATKLEGRCVKWMQ